MNDNRFVLMPDGRLTKIKSINRLNYNKTKQTVKVLVAQNYNISKDIS